MRGKVRTPPKEYRSGLTLRSSLSRPMRKDRNNTSRILVPSAGKSRKISSFIKVSVLLSPVDLWYEGLILHRSADVLCPVEGRQLQRLRSEIFIRNQTQEMVDYVEASFFLVFGVHHKPRSLLDVCVRKHLVFSA